MNPASPARRSRVLVVDDNAALADNLRDILEDAGFSVRSAGSCAEAHVAARSGFDVALVDLSLPDGNGTELAQELKESSPDSEVVLLTGHATMESALDAVRAGACAYLQKPVNPPELVMTLEMAMRHVRLHSEKRELARRAAMAEKLAAVGTMTAGLSHEIRNPLNAAALQLVVLERRVGKLPAGEQGPLLQPLHLVRDEIRRLDHILEDFLQFARPREFYPKPVEVAPVLDRVLTLLGGPADKRHVRVMRNFEVVPPVAGDVERLQQVVVNLGLNALDAVREGGWVRVSCRTADDPETVEILIDDSGPGVPPRSGSASSSRSSPPRPRAPGWGSPSSTPSSPSTAGPSRSRMLPRAARASRCGFPGRADRAASDLRRP